MRIWMVRSKSDAINSLSHVQDRKLLVQTDSWNRLNLNKMKFVFFTPSAALYSDWWSAFIHIKSFQWLNVLKIKITFAFPAALPKKPFEPHVSVYWVQIKGEIYMIFFLEQQQWKAHDNQEPTKKPPSY